MTFIFIESKWQEYSEYNILMHKNNLRYTIYMQNKY